MSRPAAIELGALDGACLRALGRGPAAGVPAGAGLLLAHGAGSDWDEPALTGVAEGLAAAGHRVLCLRWPYRERAAREGRRRPPEPLPRLVAQMAAALAAARAAWPQCPWFVGGRSLGARVAAHLSATESDAEPPAGVLALAYPLVPPRAARPRGHPLHTLRSPALFIQGGRDPFGGPAELAAALEESPAAVRLLALDRADHSLQEPRRGGRPLPEVLAQVARDADRWVRSLTEPGPPGGLADRG